MRAGLKARFWSKVSIREPKECWPWIGKRDKDGYGKIRNYYKEVRAHRLSYELNIGDIPTGKVVCHSCDNPRCVNPSHLWVGTIGDNNRDMYQKGRGRGISKCGTRSQYNKGCRCDACRKAMSDYGKIRYLRKSK